MNDLGRNVQRPFSFNQTFIKCLFKVPEQAHKMEKAGIDRMKTSKYEFPSFHISTRGDNLPSHYFWADLILNRKKTMNLN